MKDGKSTSSAALPKFVFVLGAEDIRKNPLLSSDGKKELYDMHKILVPSLPFGKEGAHLEDRWAAREKGGEGTFFVAYFLREDGVVPAMISGTKKDSNDLYIINAMTRPEFRRKGYITALGAQAIEHIKQHYPEVNTVNITVSTGVSSAADKRDLVAYIDEINRVSQAMPDADVKNHKAANYGLVVGKTLQAMADLSSKLPKVKAAFDLIPEDLSASVVFAVDLMKKHQKEVDIHPAMTYGASYNYVPGVNLGSDKVVPFVDKVKSGFAQSRRDSFSKKTSSASPSRPSSGSSSSGFRL